MRGLRCVFWSLMLCQGLKVAGFLLQTLAGRVAALCPQIHKALVDRLGFKTEK